MRVLTAACTAAFLLLAALDAMAQPTEPGTDVAPAARHTPTPRDRIVAQALFEDARRLMDQQRHREACAKFQESNRLDPAMGTQFNLADCYERIGRYASAWILFVDVAAAARGSGETDREQAARRRALAVEPRLTKLRIRVAAPIDGLVVSIDGQPIPSPQWGTASPVEPGAYRVEARASGYQPWSRTIAARGEGSTVDLLVPALAPHRSRPRPEPDATAALDSRVTAAITMAALGGVGLAVGVGTGIAAIVKKNQADEHCPIENQCYAEGIELRDEARKVAGVSTVSFAVGASALVGAVLLWLTASDAAPATQAADAATARASVWCGPEGAGGVVSLRF